MNPYVVSAQFAAYVWYSNENPEKSNEDAVSFARRNWSDFLPCAHKGVGRLLVKMTESRKTDRKHDWRRQGNSRSSSLRKTLISK
jgi:hypothetical protein